MIQPIDCDAVAREAQAGYMNRVLTSVNGQNMHLSVMEGPAHSMRISTPIHAEYADWVLTLLGLARLPLSAPIVHFQRIKTRQCVPLWNDARSIKPKFVTFLRPVSWGATISRHNMQTFGTLLAKVGNMVQLATSGLEMPHISANQLGEFVCGSERRRVTILRDNKFGNPSAAPYYSAALAGIRHSLSGGRFSSEVLLAEAASLSQRGGEKLYHLRKAENNALALHRLAEITKQLDLPVGEHRIMTQNAHFLLEGVRISVLPDFVTENIAEGYIAFTKLRFSKSKIAADVSEIVLLLLHYYGQRQSRVGLQFSFDRTRVVDCFSQTIIPGHALGRYRDQQLHEALHLIRYLWPRIERAKGENEF